MTIQITTLATAAPDAHAMDRHHPPGYRIASPLGDIVVCAEDDALTGVFFTGQKYFPILSIADAAAASASGSRSEIASASASASASGEPYVVGQAREEFGAFFAGELRDFTVPYRAMFGTAFQRQVWEQLSRIPYGESVSYGEIARRLHLPVGTARAIGSANSRNPISIIVPCHRVIAASGALTGYAGGIDKKEALLRLEMRQMQQFERSESLIAQTGQFSLQL